MKRLDLAVQVIICLFPAQALMAQVSSFPYSQDFTSNPLGGEWAVSKIGIGSQDWTHSSSDGQTGGCLKLTGYITLGGNENYLDLALNTSGPTFTGGESFTYEIFREAGALGDATVVVQQNASGSFVDISTSSSISSLTATTWTTKTVGLPSAMENKNNVTLRLKISGAINLAFDNLRLDNASISGGVLPVQLASFTAIPNGFDIELRWSTATELNNYGFEVERRNMQAGEQRWSVAGFVTGAGTSTSRREYSYVDASLAPGRYAYRIRQIDHDGSFSYTSATEVEVGNVPKAFALHANYPNPFNPTTTIRFDIPKPAHVLLTVFDLFGRELATLTNGYLQAGTHKVSFDGSRIPSGVYFYRLSAGEFVNTRTLVVLK